MKRALRPSVVTSAMPALAAFFGACSRERPSIAQVPPPPPPPPPPPVAPDAPPPDLPPPVRIDPRFIPSIPLAGAPMPVSPLPAPAPAPAPPSAPPSAPSTALQPRTAPSVMPSLAPAAAPMPAPALLTEPSARPQDVPAHAEPGVWIVHNHPPGTACRPISRAEIEQLVQALPSPTGPALPAAPH